MSNLSGYPVLSVEQAGSLDTSGFIGVIHRLSAFVFPDSWLTPLKPKRGVGYPLSGYPPLKGDKSCGQPPSGAASPMVWIKGRAPLKVYVLFSGNRRGTEIFTVSVEKNDFVEAGGVQTCRLDIWKPTVITFIAKPVEKCQEYFRRNNHGN